MKREWGFVKDPLYGYIKISQFEKKVIDTFPVQRLRRIRQLSGAEYVYPAANHTRFEHSLGAMHLAGLISENHALNLNDNIAQTLKFAGLLHDIGHGPFSHVFDQILIKYLNKTHEDMTVQLIKKTEVGDVLGSRFDVDKISELAIGRLKEKKFSFINQVISSAFDVDKMDFVPRDSYHTGAEYGYTDIFRLIHAMDVYGTNLTINSAALPTLEAFLLARLQSFKTIYFHKASRAAQIMLVKALEQTQEELSFTKINSMDDYLKLDDNFVWYQLKSCSKSANIIKNLETRQLLKCAFETVLYTKDTLVTSIFTKESVRKNLEEEIANSADIESEQVTIDVPSLPSVPYSPSALEPMDFPISFDQEKGKTQIKRVGELSRIIEVLKVYMNIIRVYTNKKYRKSVREAAAKILKDLPSETTISY
jgi:HD superfamily phosphohydrolase